MHEEKQFSHVEYPVIVGESKAIRAVREKIERVVNKNITVLIRGESGTGKDLVARFIHILSQRRGKNFVHVNCAAIPNELLESELFGHAKGAFTGAARDKPGRFEIADKGDIFLDEIGSLNLYLQAKILQVLEDNTLSRLGSIKEMPIDVRIIAATNSNLEQEVKDGNFRTDLYYRLNVISVVIPPLRERKEDICLLVNYFMDKYCNELKKDHVYLDDSAKKHLQKYPWPGNVRELENVIKGVITLQNADIVYNDLKPGKGQGKTGESFYPKDSQIWDEQKVRQFISDRRNTSLKQIRKEYIAEVERQAISKALELTHWNRKNAAGLLKVSYKTLLNRIEEFKLV